MAGKQELSVREKKELVAKEETTIPGRYYVPYADIHETDDALAVVLEMPGVEKKDLHIALENDVLRVDGQIDFTKYKEMDPVYTEYNVGHYARSFTLSNKIDQEKISANLENGVLTLTLPRPSTPSHARSRSGESCFVGVCGRGLTVVEGASPRVRAFRNRGGVGAVGGSSPRPGLSLRRSQNGRPGPFPCLAAGRAAPQHAV